MAPKKGGKRGSIEITRPVKKAEPAAALSSVWFKAFEEVLRGAAAQEAEEVGASEQEIAWASAFRKNLLGKIHSVCRSVESAEGGLEPEDMAELDPQDAVRLQSLEARLLMHTETVQTLRANVLWKLKTSVEKHIKALRDTTGEKEPQGEEDVEEYEDVYEAILHGFKDSANKATMDLKSTNEAIKTVTSSMAKTVRAAAKSGEISSTGQDPLAKKRKTSA